VSRVDARRVATKGSPAKRSSTTDARGAAAVPSKAGCPPLVTVRSVVVVAPTARWRAPGRTS
jgi:hypothetical protein